jgi:hypothetical protein
MMDDASGTAPVSARKDPLQLSRKGDMFSFWKARKARRTAATAIVPFVRQTELRLGQIPQPAWSDAYVIGFLSTLITLVAMREAGFLGTNLLASVQAAAWSDITGQDNVLLGEQICALSAAEDPTFGRGCDNAIRFFETLDAAKANEDHLDSRDLFDVAGESKKRLWTSYFDAFLGRVSPAGL